MKNLRFGLIASVALLLVMVFSLDTMADRRQVLPLLETIPGKESHPVGHISDG